MQDQNFFTPSFFTIGNAKYYKVSFRQCPSIQLKIENGIKMVQLSDKYAITESGMAMINKFFQREDDLIN